MAGHGGDPRPRVILLTFLKVNSSVMDIGKGPWGGMEDCLGGTREAEGRQEP